MSDPASTAAAAAPATEPQEGSAAPQTKRPADAPASADSQPAADKRTKTEHYVREADVGITEYVLPGWTGFSAIIKHRFADFLVNEIDAQGRVVRLTSYTAVDDPKAPPTEEEMAVAALGVPEDGEAAFARGVEMLGEILGSEDAERIREHLQPKDTDAEAGAAADAEAETTDAGLLLDRSLDKEQRRAVYRVTNNFFGTAVRVDTVDGQLRFARTGRRAAAGERGGSKKPQQKRSRGWGAQWNHVGDHCHFVLQKENSDTMDVVQQLAQLLRVNVRAFGTAGTKDKRAVTVQRCSAHRVAHERLQQVSRRMRGARLGNFSYGSGLRLGDLAGNRFVIVLRFVEGADEGSVGAALESVRERGFVNYFGLQRFGSHSVASHEVGRAALRADWREAVDLVLRPRVGESLAMEAARALWAAGDVAGALEKMPPRGALAERAVLRRLLSKDAGASKNWAAAFAAIPHNLRLMYVHAFQSLVWNRAASCRVREFGVERAVPGDLALRRGAGQLTLLSPDADEAEEGAGAEEGAAAEEQPQQRVPRQQQQVELVTEANCHEFSIFDVVLPLPGCSVTYPGHSVRLVYEQTLASSGLLLETFGTQGAREYRLQGAYRHVLTRPRDFEHAWMRFNDASLALARSDSQKIEGTHEPESIAWGEHCALKLAFDLPSSAYATMMLREVMRRETASGHQSARRAPTGASEAESAALPSTAAAVAAAAADDDDDDSQQHPLPPASSSPDSALLKRVSSLPGSLSILRAHLTNPEFHMAPQYTRRQALVMAAHEPDDTWAYGAILLALTVVVFVGAVYALAVSKVMPHTGVAVLDAVKDDHYYCLLLPVSALSFVIAVFCNWLGMKYFRHN
ncbi:multisubstrate pseudouridine synthase 7 [Coemansia erecta]|uniref:Multisubstrate pseudouridine synthase 7 n=1 Tax=Coemansia erecta TaxID=147472 RepID=A0A9W7XVI2_9FUNG|nr:multisubstrate pseudouridine synthase 7 [Coemansia erecta]